MHGLSRRLGSSDRAAVAPIVALSLFGIVAVGGLAFDYARLANLDSELQNGADQAALAAAGQLDGKADAITRATAAARSLVQNKTLFANESGGSPAITVPTLVFYTGYDRINDLFGPVTNDGTTAKVVRVTIGARTASYALTPIVGALTSGSVSAQAVAGLDTAVCKVPPLMMCNPNETSDPAFDTNYAGRGLLLVARQNSTDAYGPGNFGFLDTGYDASGGGGTSVLRRALGQENFLADCIAGDTVTTEPGASAPALDAINTRFDIYSSNVQQSAVCGNGQCPPSANVRKDLMREAGSGGGGSGIIKNFCKPSNEDTGQKGWKLAPASGRYLPPSNAPLTAAQRAALAPMGHPRDICHAATSGVGCGGSRIGTGTWDRDAYFQANYAFNTSQWTAQLGSSPTRYQTYLWERLNNLNTNPAGYNKTPTAGTPPNQGSFNAKPVCQPSGAVIPNGDIDRRRLTMAVVNCNGTPKVQGKVSGVPVVKWVDVFLVEPSWPRDRTTAEDLYVEIIGKAEITGPGGAAYQVERSVPYLIR